MDAKVELGLEVLLFLWRQSRCGSHRDVFQRPFHSRCVVAAFSSNLQTYWALLHGVVWVHEVVALRLWSLIWFMSPPSANASTDISALNLKQRTPCQVGEGGQDQECLEV